MARYPATKNVIKVEMYTDSTADPGLKWRDISSSVRYADGINIRHGRQDESSNAAPAAANFTLKDPSGYFNRRNPNSPYFGYLGQGTPLRIRTQCEYEDFSATAVDSWGTAGEGGAWTLIGTAANFDKAAGVGTVVVPSALDVRVAYLPNSVHADVDLEATFSLSAASITGASTVVGLVARGVSSSDYIVAKVEIKTDNTMSLSITTDDGAAIGLGGTWVVPNATYAQDRQFTVRLAMYNHVYAAKVWQTTSAEPKEFLARVVDTALPKYSGWIGTYATRLTSSTNANIVVSWRNFVARSQRFSGEFSSFKPVRDASGLFTVMDIECAGILRRLGQGEEPLLSAIRRSAPDLPSLVAYWPMEEQRNATQFTAVAPTGGVAANPLEIQSDAKPNYATESGWVSSDPLPVINLSAFGASLPDYTLPSPNKFQARFLAKIPTTGSTTNAVLFRIWGSGTARLFQLMYNVGTTGDWVLEVYDRDVANILSTVVHTGINGDYDRVSIELTQSGANINWRVSRYSTDSGAVGTATGTLNSRTFGKFDYVDFDPFFNHPNTAVGHLTLQNDVTSMNDLIDEQNAYLNELAGNRLDRLADENSIPYLGTDWGFPASTETAAMGRQVSDSLMTLLRECGETDMGTLFDARGFDLPYLEYRPLVSIYSQLPTLTLDMAAGQVAQPYAPVDDDLNAFNDIIAKNREGGEYNAKLETGPMSTASPDAGGIGRKDTQYTVNAAKDAQLQGIAGWQLGLGTVDEFRFPTLTVDLANNALVAAGKANQVLDLGADDFVKITNAQSSRVYDDIEQLTRGYREYISSTIHRITFNCAPESPYATTVLDSTTFPGYLDAVDTKLDLAVSSSATSLNVRSKYERWEATTFPYDIKVTGERMRVTACTSNVTTLVNNSAFVHANNASTALTLPASHAAGDVLLIFAAIRNTAATPIAPAGYFTLLDMTNVRIFGKYDNGAETNPTVTYTGGAAGDDTSAAMTCLRYTSLSVMASGSILNGSAASIAGLASTVQGPVGGGACMVSVFWKQDDWTTATDVGGLVTFTGTTTTGNDQGLGFTLEYADGLTNGQHSSQGITLTGGASAVSRLGVIALYGTQIMTVTRSINGVSKAHAVDEAVNVFQPIKLAV